MTRKTKAEKQLDAAVNKAYLLIFNGVPVNMMDLPKIFEAIRQAILDVQANSKAGETWNVPLAKALSEIKSTYARP
jgi:hypothetical protein